MASDRTGSNVYWTILRSLVDGELVTKALLYDQALHRLQDIGAYLLAKFSTVIGDYASTQIGTQYTVTGGVDLTAFDYNGGAALNGLTFIADEDTGGPQTCTFDNTVTNPSILLAQLTAQAGSNVIYTLNGEGKLVVKSGTYGSASSLSLSGTAFTMLMDPALTQNSSDAVNDGASKIGIAAFTSPTGWAGGTLRDFLQALFSGLDMTNADVALKLAKAGDTFTGPLVPSGSTARVRKRAPVLLPTTSASFGPTADEFVIPNFTGSTITYTANLTTGPALAEGDDILIISPGFNGSGDVATIATEGGPTLATIDNGSVYTWIRIGLDTTNDSPNKTPYVKSYGPSITLILPYNLP